MHLEARCRAADVEQFISCSACKMKRMSRTLANLGFGLYDLLPLPKFEKCKVLVNFG
jgi:hypothetical protein